MSFRNERFMNSFRSLDALLDGFDQSKAPILSDNGDGARQICRAADCEDDSKRDRHRASRLARARERLVSNGLGRLLPVLDQIVINGKNRRESIWRLAQIWHIKTPIARLRYYRGSTALLTLFSPNKIKGETNVRKSK